MLSRVADALDSFKVAARQGGCSLLLSVELTPAASDAYIETQSELEQLCCDQSHEIGAAVFMLNIMKTYAWSNPSLAFDFMLAHSWTFVAYRRYSSRIWWHVPNSPMWCLSPKLHL